MRWPHSLALALGALILSACGSTKILKDAPPPERPEQPIAAASDDAIAADLQWVIVRNGPGAWAKNADWDEYLLQIRNQSAAPVTITDASIVSSLNHQNSSLARRKDLVKNSKRVVRDYKHDGLKVKAGMGGGTLIASGVGATVTGAGIVAAQVTASIGTGTAASTGVVATGLILGGPILVGAGTVRAVRNAKVNNRIELRHTALPLTIAAGQTANLALFFALTPSPLSVHLSYRDELGDHQLVVRTEGALSGLHMAGPTANQREGI